MTPSKIFALSVKLQYITKDFSSEYVKMIIQMIAEFSAARVMNMLTAGNVFSVPEIMPFA